MVNSGIRLVKCEKGEMVYFANFAVCFRSDEKVAGLEGMGHGAR
jgi:hypothetical protein